MGNDTSSQMRYDSDLATDLDTDRVAGTGESLETWLVRVDRGRMAVHW